MASRQLRVRLSVANNSRRVLKRKPFKISCRSRKRSYTVGVVVPAALATARIVSDRSPPRAHKREAAARAAIIAVGPARTNAPGHATTISVTTRVMSCVKNNNIAAIIRIVGTQ